MSQSCCHNTNEPYAEPYVINLMCAAKSNYKFRNIIWTGSELQVTVMCIPVGGEVGKESHPDSDQMLRVEMGKAMVCIYSDDCTCPTRHHLCAGDAVMLPCGTVHNVVNTGSCPLKLSSVYAPLQHPKDTMDCEH